MTQKAKERLEKVRDALHDAVQDLNRRDYTDVLENLGTDIDGQLEAVRAETKLDEADPWR